MTTTTQHTPGPWNADKNFMGPDTYGDGNSIPVFPRGGGVDSDDGGANDEVAAS